MGRRGLLSQELESQTNQLSNLVTDLISDVMTLYLQFYKKKDYATCVYLLTYMLMMSQNLSQFEQPSQLNLTHSDLLQQCLKINLVYQQLQVKSQQKKSEKKTDKKKSVVSTENKAIFLSDPVHQEYMKALYDVDSLEIRPQPPSQTNTASLKLPSSSSSSAQLQGPESS